MAAIMNFYNFVYSAKGSKLTSYGISGKMNKTENGKTSILSPYVDDFSTARSNGINFTPFTHFFSGDAYLQITLGGKPTNQLDPATTQFYDGLMMNKPYLFTPSPIFVTKAYQEKQGQIMPKLTSLLDECVIGQISTDQFFAQYKTLKANGLQKIIDEGAAAYKRNK